MYAIRVKSKESFPANISGFYSSKQKKKKRKTIHILRFEETGPLLTK
jgi:hypothetical protein